MCKIRKLDDFQHLSFLKNTGLGIISKILFLGVIPLFLVISIGVSFSNLREKEEEESSEFHLLYQQKVKSQKETIGDVSSTLWQAPTNSNGDNTLNNIINLDLSTPAIQIAYSFLSDSELDYLIDYLRSAQLASESQQNKPPAWLLVGIHSLSQDDIKISNGVYIPNTGIDSQSWKKDINGVTVDFRSQSESIINSLSEEPKRVFQGAGFGIQQDSNYDGLFKIYNSAYDKYKVIKGSVDDKYNLYNSMYTTANILGNYYKMIQDIETYYAIKRAPDDKEPVDFKPFDNWTDEEKWILASLMMYEGLPYEIYEEFPIESMNKLKELISQINSDREFFDTYTSNTYGIGQSSKWTRQQGKANVVKNLVTNNNIKIDSGLKSFYDVNEINMEHFYEDIQKQYLGLTLDNTNPSKWGKSRELYTHPVSTVPSIRHILKEPLALYDGDKQLAIVNSDTLYSMTHMIYMGKYYAGVGQFVANAEQQRRSITGSIGKTNTTSNPSEPMGIMYYWQYAKMKQLNGATNTDEMLNWAIKSYNEGKVPKERYTESTAQETQPDKYEGPMQEYGWKGNYPLFRQAADSIKNNYFWSGSGMGNAGCSLYTAVTMLHGIGLGQDPPPKFVGSEQNALNEFGDISPESLRAAYLKVESTGYCLDDAHVRDVLGYTIKTKNMNTKNNLEEYQANLNNVFNDLKKGIPYAAVFYAHNVPGVTYWGENISKSFVSGTGGHYVLLASGREVGGKRYFEVVDCNGGNGINRANNFAYYDFDNVYNTYGVIRQGLYTIISSAGTGTSVTRLKEMISNYKTVNTNNQVIWRVPMLGTDSNGLVDVYVDSNGVQHLEIYDNANSFLDITGVQISSEISSETDNARLLTAGTILAVGNGTVRQGIYDISTTKRTYKDLTSESFSVAPGEN